MATELVEPPAATIASTLESFWGRDWAVVKEKLLAEGEDLSLPFLLRPWEEIEEDMHRWFVPEHDLLVEGAKELFMEWPQEPTLEAFSHLYRLPDGFTEADVYEIVELASPYNRSFEEIAQRYALALAAVLETKWSTSDYVRVPFSTKAVPFVEDTTDNFMASSLAHGGGWTLKYALSKSAYPDLVAMRDEMQAVQVRRDSELRRFLRAWRR